MKEVESDGEEQGLEVKRIKEGREMREEYIPYIWMRIMPNFNVKMFKNEKMREEFLPNKLLRPTEQYE